MTAPEKIGTLFHRVLADENLSLEELKAILCAKEGLFHDFKNGQVTHEPTDKFKQDIRKNVSAFANSEGGMLVIGPKNRRNYSRSPKIVSCAEKVGDEPIQDWAHKILAELAPYLWPPPRIKLVAYKRKKILIIATARASTLVPCRENGVLKHYFRFFDSTLEAPPYLIRDLMLGRRSHPIFEIADIHCGLNYPSVIGGDDPRAWQAVELNIGIDVHNASLLDAENVKFGLVGWIEKAYVRTPLRSEFLLSYLDVTVPPQLEDLNLEMQHTAREQLSISAFGTTRCNSPGSQWIVVPAKGQVQVICAVYLKARNSEPQWFELEIKVEATGWRQASVIAKDARSVGRARPRVSWAST